MRWWRRRGALPAAVLVVLAAVATWLLWPEREPPAQRERQYHAETACLLTDDRGLAGEPAQATWAGMQEASAATRIKVQYLAVSGPQNPGNALSYFNSLALQRCTLVVAAGEVPVAALVSGHARFPEPRYVAVGGQKPAGSALTWVPDNPPDQVRSAVRDLVRTAS